jgi:hypothetical protein
MLRSLRERRLARRKELLARRFAEFRARAERGDWLLVGVSQWVDSGRDYRRTVTSARLKAQHPAAWWAGGAECWDYHNGVETRPKPQPIQHYHPDYNHAQQRPVPSAAPQYPAARIYAINTQGPTAVNYQNNGGK